MLTPLEILIKLSILLNFKLTKTLAMKLFDSFYQTASVDVGGENPRARIPY